MIDKVILVTCGYQDILRPSQILDLQSNLKTKTRSQLDKLKNQILKYGFSFPLFVWQNDEKIYSIDGHGRRFVTEELLRDGYRFKYEDGTICDKIPVVMIQAKDRQEAKEKLLAVNSNYGTFTEDGLYSFLNEPNFELNFDELKVDLELPGIDLNAFENGWMTDEIIDTEDVIDKAEELQEKWQVKIGDLWKLGEHQLLCGDSILKKNIEKLMDGQKADMVFTDPSYDMKIDGIYLVFDNCLGLKPKIQFWMTSDKQSVQLASRYYSLFCHFFIHDFKVPTLISNNQPMQAHNIICKFGNVKINNLKDGFSTIIKVATLRTSNEHKYFGEGKRIELPEIFILHYSNKNNIILDVFGGLGSTLLACERTKRKCRMIEIEPKYCSVILQRWEDTTGEKVVRID